MDSDTLVSVNALKRMVISTKGIVMGENASFYDTTKMLASVLIIP